MDPNDLKPCPFCGGRAHRDELDDGGLVIQCSGCLASSAVYYDRAENLVRSWNYRKLPEGMAIVPREITAETGHKAEMMGEFFERIGDTCPQCEGSGRHDSGDCDLCDCLGEVTREIGVSWTTIKAIHKRIVEIAEPSE